MKITLQEYINAQCVNKRTKDNFVEQVCGGRTLYCKWKKGTSCITDKVIKRFFKYDKNIQNITLDYGKKDLTIIISLGE